VMLSPTVAGPAPKMGWGTRTSFITAYLNGARFTPFTQAWNLAGFPAMSLPIPPIRGAIPSSVQLVAAPGREAALLTLARQLESSTLVLR
jgi:amidase